MEITRQQKFNIDFFEFTHDGFKYRVGLGNYKDQDAGCEMFYPESGSEYMLVIFDNGWYKFEMYEFTHTAGIYYIADKLKCSEKDAEVIHQFIASVLQTEAAKYILTDKTGFKNPFIPR